MRRFTPLLSVMIVALAAGLANAQDVAVAEDTRQMTIPKGRAIVEGYVEVSLFDGAAFEPVSIAPDLWYGVTEEITVGFVHSGRAATGFYGGVGNGLCLTGSDAGCADPYDGFGLDGRYHFFRNPDATISADGGLFVQSFDPFQLALKAGLAGRWQSGKIALDFSPNIFAGLTSRSEDAGMVEVTTNGEILNLPAAILYAATPTLGVAAQVGAVVPLQETGDTWFLPVSLGAQYMVGNDLWINGAISLPFLVSGDAILIDGFDARTLTLGVGYAL